MGEKRYMISDAARKVDVEPHVLRYWEDEIGIEIPRNEMGHRYYRKEDITLRFTEKFSSLLSLASGKSLLLPAGTAEILQTEKRGKVVL